MSGIESKPRVEVTRPMVGICHAQVCAVPDATDEEVLAVMERDNPAGTSGGWVRVLRDGEHGPVPCQGHEGRVHLLVEC